MSSFDSVRKPFTTTTPSKRESESDSWSSNPNTPQSPPTNHRTYSTSTITDPWNTTPRSFNNNITRDPPSFPIEEHSFNQNNNNNDELQEEGGGYGTGSEPEQWELGPQEKVEITQREELAGNFLLKHLIWTIHSIKTDSVVERRYSDFVWLLECLTKRYPFRILPSLPPKQLSLVGTHLGTDDLFLERRRKGLCRFLCFAINHPTLRNDHLLRTFLCEHSDLSIWRKTAQYTLEEESVSRILTTAEELSIPASFEGNLKSLTIRIHSLVEHWTEISRTYDRLAHRLGNQGKDWLKLKSGMEAAVEVERSGWRSGESEAVERKVLVVSEFAGRVGELDVTASIRAVDSTVEELKRHRELYVNFRDLISRQVRLSPDGVDKLRKRTETNMQKLDQLRKSPPKANFEVEVESLATNIEHDQRMAERLLRRRSFIRWAMYQEFLFLFRSTSLLSVALKDFATDELIAAERVQKNWNLLAEAL